MEIYWRKERTGVERAGRESRGNLEKNEIQQKSAGKMDGKI